MFSCFTISLFYYLLLCLLITITISLRASASIFCEDPFSSSTPYAEELEYNIDFLIDHQDIRQCHFPGDQNRAEDRYEEEAYNPNEEGQHVFQSLSPD